MSSSHAHPDLRPDESGSSSLEAALALLARSNASGLRQLDIAIKALVEGLNCRAAGFVRLLPDGETCESLVARSRTRRLKGRQFAIHGNVVETLYDAAAAGEVVPERYIYVADGLCRDFAMPPRVKRMGGVACRCEVILDETGAPVAHVVAILDEAGPDRPDHRNFFRLVSQLAGSEYRRMLADEARRRSESSFRNLIEGSQQGFIIHRDGKPIFANAAYARILGYDTVEEVLALDSILENAAPEERERMAGFLEARKRGDPAPERYEYRGLRADGSLVWLSVFVRLIEWDGAPAVEAAVSDVTEQHEAEHNRTLVAGIVDSANLAIVGRDLNGIIFSWNAAADRVYGYTAEEAIGQSVSIVAAPGYEDEWREIGPAVLCSESTITSEYQRRRKDGTPITVRACFSPVYDATGRAIGVSSISQDITPVRRLERALERNQLLLQKAQHMGSMGFWTWQAGRNGLTLSTQARRVLGMGPEEGSIVSLQDYAARFVHPDDRPRVGRLLSELGPSNGVVSDSHRIVTANARARTVQLWGETIFDRQGQAASMVGMIQDVTEVEQVREALIASEARFRDFADVATDWIWETGIDGRFRYVSDRVSAVTGFPASYYMGKTWTDCMAPSAGAAPSLYESEVAARQAFRDLTFRIETMDGREAWVSLSGKPSYESGLHFQGYRGACSDVTLRKQTEVALRRAMETAEKANEIKSRFLAAASHDLRQPLHAMRLLVTSLISCDFEAERQVITAEIASGLRSMTDILNALLDVSELDAGRVQPDVREFDLGQLFESVAVTAASRAAEKGLSFRVRPADLRVRSDPALLARIVENFLSNAVQHTQSGGVLLGCRRRGARLRIEVFDTGPGIPADKHAAIFQEYLQLETSAGRDERGLGLGLAIVRRFASLLEHPIDLQSRVGRGSRFAVEVPLAAAGRRDAERPAEAPLQTLDLAGIFVLLIENDQAVREATRRLLAERGAEVLAAAGIAEAQRRLGEARRPPDLIMTDLDLSEEIDGPEAVERLRKRYGLMIPAILLSGETRSARLGEAARSGLPLLRKPASPESIWKTISDILRHGQAAE